MVSNTESTRGRLRARPASSCSPHLARVHLGRDRRAIRPGRGGHRPRPARDVLPLRAGSRPPGPVGRFSDGASYALSLGINNGDLFTDVLAFSPGFMAPSMSVGTPRFFVSHGRRDRVLPIERCSRRIVPQLERAGYEVTYREFDGGHTVPPEITLEAAGRFALNEGREEGESYP